MLTLAILKVREEIMENSMKSEILTYLSTLHNIYDLSYKYIVLTDKCARDSKASYTSREAAHKAAEKFIRRIS